MDTRSHGFCLQTFLELKANLLQMLFLKPSCSAHLTSTVCPKHKASQKSIVLAIRSLLVQKYLTRKRGWATNECTNSTIRALWNIGLLGIHYKRKLRPNKAWHRKPVVKVGYSERYQLSSCKAPPFSGNQHLESSGPGPWSRAEGLFPLMATLAW